MTLQTAEEELRELEAYAEELMQTGRNSPKQNPNRQRQRRVATR